MFIIVKFTEDNIYLLNHFQMHNSVASKATTVLDNHHYHPPPELFLFPKLNNLSSTLDLHILNLDFLRYYHGIICGLSHQVTCIISLLMQVTW